MSDLEEAEKALRGWESAARSLGGGSLPDAMRVVLAELDRLRALPDADPILICGKLTEWAVAARVERHDTTGDVSKGGLAVYKSDLLGRLIHGGEAGPSQTKCPVHLGVWSGCQFGWPGSVRRRVDPTTGSITESPGEVDPYLQEMWDAGCRCATHKGSNCTTGWNPDGHCCG